jgi:hypothetical protein
VGEDLNRERLAILGELGRLTQQINAYNAQGIQNAQRETELNRERLRIGRQLQRVNLELQKAQRQSYVDSINSMKSLSSMYDPLKKADKERIELMLRAGNLSDAAVDRGNKLADINQKISQLTADQTLERQILQEQFDSEIVRFGRMAGISDEIVNNLRNQNELARDYSSMTEGQKEQLAAQLETYKTIKNTIGGILDTASILTSGPAGLLGMSLIGAGKFVGKLGEVRSQLGGLSEMGTTALAFLDENAVENAKELASQFGGMNNVSGELQASISLISANMGISGVEAASLAGSFARLNDGSSETALNLTKATQEFAMQNGIIPSELMADLAGSAEEFALFGKDGGKNLIQAGAAAKKMGVDLKTMTGIADNLLDFETSITKELELGALMGKNINLDKARQLAFSGDIAGATEETLKALGGIEAFNKMDYYQKKASADLLGVSVAELQKMVSAEEEAARMAGTIGGKFSLLGESIDAGLNKYLGTSLEALGGMVMAGAQLGGSFAQMGVDVKGMVSGGLDKLKGLFGFGGGGAAPSPIPSPAPGPGGPIPPVPEGGGGGLTSLAAGLKEMGSAKVLFGALNLIPTAAGLALMVVGIPSMMALGAFGANAGVGLELIGIGLQAMGNPQALLGALTLSVAAVGFALMTAGALGLGAIAVGGAAAGAGLIGLTTGLVALGTAAMTGVPFAGLALLAGFGIALIPLTYALSLLAPLVESIGNVIIGTITAIANGISTVVGSIGQLIPLFNLENAAGLLAMAGGFAALSLSLMGFAVASVMAIPGMIAVGAFLALGGGELLGGGGEGEGGGGGSDMDALISEIKGLRADLASGKIGVNMDGASVTARVSSHVDKSNKNSYAK